MYQMDQYMDAQVERQKTAALFVGFVTRRLAGRAAAGEDAPDADDGTGLAQLRPALFQKLLPGEDVTFSQPPGVGNDFDPFLYRVCLELAAGVGLPYAVLTGDLRQTSYGSQRAGLVEFRRRMEQLQHGVFVFQLCRPVYQRWLATRCWPARSICPASPPIRAPGGRASGSRRAGSGSIR